MRHGVPLCSSRAIYPQTPHTCMEETPGSRAPLRLCWEGWGLPELRGDERRSASGLAPEVYGHLTPGPSFQLSSQGIVPSAWTVIPRVPVTSTPRKPNLVLSGARRKGLPGKGYAGSGRKKKAMGVKREPETVSVLHARAHAHTHGPV